MINDERLLSIAKSLMEDEDTCMFHNYMYLDLAECDLDTLVDDIKSEFKYLYLPLCGCGNPELVCMEIMHLLSAIDARNNDDEGDPLYNYYGVHTLSSWAGDDWCRLLALYSLNESGFLDHGSSVYSSWVTDRGRDFVYLYTTYPDIKEENKHGRSDQNAVSEA